MQVLGVLLPLAFAVAFSSVPIMAMLGILLSRWGRSSGPAYLLGYAIGLAVVTVGFTAGLRAIPRVASPIPPVLFGVIELLLGAVCIATAVLSFRAARRSIRAGERREPSLLLRHAGNLRPVPAFGIGLALNLRPKALVLATAAAVALTAGSITPVGWVIVTVVYLVIGLSTVAAPVFLAWREGERSRVVLERMRGWLEGNSYIVTSVVVFMVGVVLVGDGLTRF
ncbi:GAP family protein [Homoserinibacter sp. GY 40078]|uniref:GAP family protein n=1 Tax=Homoserinibacter sp. GY 40078 TaxID=2603275 RepID=UPI0011C9D13F|nr:GAP family protein [Homoserinibacter sp. GY 40078]TXK16387.1 hypothetical protein FVQ89_14160 [Homoserinibacter sp. GY 40078]